MKTVSRKKASEVSDDYKEILEKESHHNHEIIEDESGALRWKPDPGVREIVFKGILNDLWYLFQSMGLSKNSEPVRKLYRDMGYSLSGYWEIFYWEVNNAKAKEYRPHTKHDESRSCPKCQGNTIKSLGYDYDLAKVFYECMDCDHVGDSSEFDGEKDVKYY